MKNLSIKKALEKIAENDGRKTTITRCGGGRKYHRDANYLVRVKTGAGRTMDDGTYWDGWETVGHYRAASDAVFCAMEASGVEIGGAK